MSTANIGVLGPPQADDLYNPEFAVVLRGYDPEEVRAYVQNVATHIEALQRQLQDARDQIEAARRQYMAAKEAAYRQLGSQMAELLHTADLEAERLKREGAEEASRKVSEAERVAIQSRREAEEHADTLRREGEETLWRARAETERILGGLALKREETLKELEATRGRLRAVMASLESTITVTREEAKRGSEAATDVEDRAHTEAESLRIPDDFADEAPDADPERAAVAQEAISDVARGIDPAMFWEERGRTPSAERDEMLGTVEGFDLILPDIRIDEDGEVS